MPHSEPCPRGRISSIVLRTGIVRIGIVRIGRLRFVGGVPTGLLRLTVCWSSTGSRRPRHSRPPNVNYRRSFHPCVIGLPTTVDSSGQARPRTAHQAPERAPCIGEIAVTVGPTATLAPDTEKPMPRKTHAAAEMRSAWVRLGYYLAWIPSRPAS